MQQFVAGPAQFRRTFGLRPRLSLISLGFTSVRSWNHRFEQKAAQFKVVRPTPAQKQVG
jgi:hypothetical protein